ncbi:MAG: MMPL family transporter [Myxococcales bacterium]|nr:MMPL family transporter [Myxococcales bacterium]
MSESPPKSAVATLAERLARAVVARPLLTLGLVLVVLAGSAWLARGLEVDTALSALLPENAPETREVDVVGKKLGGTIELVIAVGGPKEPRLEFARRLVTALRELPSIRWAELEYPVDFFIKRRAWFLSLKKLGKLAESIDVAIQRARARANPLYVDLEDDDEKKQSKPDDWAQINKTRKEVTDRLPRIYTSKDGKWLFLRVKPNVMGSEMSRITKILANVKAVVKRLDPHKDRLEVRYAGALPVNVEQHARMTADIQRASIIALVLVLLLTTAYIRRAAATVVLALPLLVGLATTLAITTLTIGRLNLVSGFLVSALIGLGIDFGVHLYLRFLEELRRSGDKREAMIAAAGYTFPGCFTAAATTAAAFLSMTISDFRGFREYGEIASFGVLFTLVATFVALPPLAMLVTRLPREDAKARKPLRLPLVPRMAWVIVIASGAFFVFSCVVLPNVGWHNDFKQLRGKSEAVDFYEYVEAQLGTSLSPAAFMVDDIDQARRAAAILERYTHGKDRQLKRVMSLADLVPRQVSGKQKIMRRIEASLRKLLRKRRRLKKRDLERAEKALALVTVPPWSVDDVPQPYRRRFVSVDGKNTFVFAWSVSELYLDADLLTWADFLSAREKEIKAAGIKVTVLEENRVGARAIRETKREWPYVFAYATIAVVIVLLIDFRSPRKVALLVLSLGVGFAWIVGGMYITGIQLNIFNQSVLPTILGIGIDNAVHMQHRYDAEGPGSISKVLSTTGAAALLASVTTAIGFGSTVVAAHYGVNTLGWLSIIGITATFAASILFFLALLMLLERAPRARAVDAALRNREDQAAKSDADSG